MRFRLLGLVALISSGAFAQRISIPNFAGPGAGTVRNQLVGAVCDTADCVAATKTTTGNKPDWKKAKKESVLFFVTGTVTKRGKALSLDLQVLNKAGPAKAKKTFPLDKNGTLAAKNLQQAMDLLSGAFASGKTTEPEPEPEPVKPTETTPPVKTTKTTTPPPDTGKKPVATTTPEPTEPVGTTPPVPAKKSRHKFLVIDAGADITTRNFVYQQVATPNLRRYGLPPTGQPTLGLQFFPFALMGDGALSGLGVDASFGFAPWIQSRLISSGDAYPTSTMRLDVGLRFDIMPLSTFALAITPYVGFRTHSFTVGASNGNRIDGLPNVSYTGLRAGLMLDVPVIADRLSIFGRFLVIPTFSSGEIISSAFFPNGSTFGIEADAGLGVWILPMLQVRASFEFINYALTFKTNTGDPYVAAGATDTWLGGNAALRLAF